MYQISSNYFWTIIPHWQKSTDFCNTFIELFY